MNPYPLAYQLSYWERNVFFEDIDVAIVGSGIVGLSAALSMHELQPGLRIVVLERGPLPIGASTRNAGFACFGSMTELISDLEHQEEEQVWELVKRRYDGLQILRRRLGEGAIDFQEAGGYELFREDDEESYAHCLDHLGAFNRILKDITGRDEVFGPADDHIGRFGFRRVRHLIRNSAEGQLHPGRMVQKLLRIAGEKGIQVISGLPVHALHEEGGHVLLEAGPEWTIHARRALVATNALAQQLVPSLPVVSARNQVMITRPVPGLPVRGSFHYDRGFYYFRDVGGRLLIGGGRNLALREEQTVDLGANPMIRAALLRLVQEVILPGRPFEVERWWSGLLGIGNSKSPILERVSPNVCVAVRLGGMGIALGSTLGEQSARLLLEISSPVER